MLKALKFKKSFLYGAVILTLSSLIAKLLGALYRVPLMSMIGSTGLGIFQLIFPVYSFFLILISGGMSSGMSKVISLENQKCGGQNNKKLLVCATKLMLMFSGIASFVILLICYPLAKMQGNPEFFILYIALLPALVFSSIISVFRGYYQGHQNMFPSGISLVIEQSGKLLASLILARLFIKKSLTFAVFGAFLGISISEVFALLYFVIRYFYKRHSFNSSKTGFDKKQLQTDDNKESAKSVLNDTTKSTLTNKECYKLILKTTFPIMLNNIILPLTGAIESILAVFLLKKASLSSEISTSLYGLADGIVSSLINLPVVISTAISTSILPSIVASFNIKDTKECEKKCFNALKITWLVCLPCFLVFLFFSKDIVLFLYSNGLSNTNFDELKIVVDLIKLNSLNILYVSLLGIITAILQAINKSFVPVKNLAIASLVRIVLTFLLVPNASFNIYGIAISDSICFSLALVLDMFYLKTQLNIFFDTREFVIKPAVCSLCMLSVIFLSKAVFGLIFTKRLLTFVIMLMGLVCYIFLLFFTNVVSKNEFVFLKKLKHKS